jgi:hypothetical protein
MTAKLIAVATMSALLASIVMVVLLSHQASAADTIEVSVLDRR